MKRSHPLIGCLLLAAALAAALAAGEGADRGPATVDRVRAFELSNVRELFWDDAGKRSWLTPVHADGTPLTGFTGDLTLRLHGGWQAFWSEQVDGDLELALRAVDGRFRTLCWAWSTSYRSAHEGMIRSVGLDGDRLHLVLEVVREFETNYYNPDRVTKPKQSTTLELALRREGDRFTGDFTVVQANYRHGVSRGAGKVTGTIGPLWPAAVADHEPLARDEHPRLLFRGGQLADLKTRDTMPAKDARERLATLAGEGDPVALAWQALSADDAAAAARAADWVRGVWLATGYTPKDESRRLWTFPHDLEAARDLMAAALVYDLCHGLWEEGFRRDVAEWLVREAEWCHVRSVTFPPHAPWYAVEEALATWCLLAVLDETAPLLRENYNINLPLKVPVLAPPAGVAYGEGFPRSELPNQGSIVRWLCSAPIPGLEHPELFAAHGGPEQAFFGPDDLLVLGQDEYPFHLLDGDVVTDGVNGGKALAAAKLSGGKAGHTVVLCTVMSVATRQKVMVRFGYPNVRAWLGGREIVNNEELRLEAGEYPLLAQVPLKWIEGPGGMALVVSLRLIARLDDELFCEAYRQHVTHGEMRTYPRLILPRAELGLQRWVRATVGGAGWCADWDMDWSAIGERYPDCVLRHVLPAMIALRTATGRDLGADPAVANLGRAYAWRCEAEGRAADPDILAAGMELSREVLFLPDRRGVAMRGDGSREAAFAAPLPGLSALVALASATGVQRNEGALSGTGLYDAAGGLLCYGVGPDMAPQVRFDGALLLRGLPRATWQNPPDAGQVTLRAWGADWLCAVPVRHRDLGRRDLRNVLQVPGTNGLLGGRVIRAEDGGNDDHEFLRWVVDLADPLRGPAPDGIPTVRNKFHVYTPHLDTDEGYVPGAFADLGLTGRREVAIARRRSGGELLVAMADRVDGDQVPEGCRLHLHTAAGRPVIDGRCFVVEGDGGRRLVARALPAEGPAWQAREVPADGVYGLSLPATAGRTLVLVTLSGNGVIPAVEADGEGRWRVGDLVLIADARGLRWEGAE